MNLTILYQMNSVGEKLLNAMQKMFEEVEYRVLAINSLDYYQIDRIDRFSSVRRIINTPRAVRNSLNMEQAAGILSVNNILMDWPRGNRKSKATKWLNCRHGGISIKVTTS